MELITSGLETIDDETDFEQESSEPSQSTESLASDSTEMEESSSTTTKNYKKKHLSQQFYASVALTYHTFRRKFRFHYWFLHPYCHWWLFCSLYNITLLVLFFTESWIASTAAIMGIVNVLVAVFIRNGFFLRILYEVEVGICTLLLRIPLLKPVVSFAVFQIHRSVHNIGGVHSGSAIFTIVWVIIYLIEAPIQYTNGKLHVGLLQLITLEITAGILLLMIVFMCFFALPFVRNKHHNIFEWTHRFCGWTATGVLVAHAAVAQGAWFPFTPGFSLALSIGMLVFYPWLLIRRNSSVKVLKVGPRAIALAFEPGVVESPPGTAIKFSFSPLLEWHSFAVAGNVPVEIRQANQQRTQTAIIARAGDWTGRLIDQQISSQLPTENQPEGNTGYHLYRPIWIHLHTPPGFMYSARAYREVLFVATGAGIAPILSYLQKDKKPLVQKRNVLWIGNKPQDTFGIFAESVFAIPDLVVHDTAVNGRPVVEELCLKTFKSFPNCQAIFVVANQPVTRALQMSMFFYNIPCFGAEWDS